MSEELVDKQEQQENDNTPASLSEEDRAFLKRHNLPTEAASWCTEFTTDAV